MEPTIIEPLGVIQVQNRRQFPLVRTGTASDCPVLIGGYVRAFYCWSRNRSAKGDQKPTKGRQHIFGHIGFMMI